MKYIGITVGVALTMAGLAIAVWSAYIFYVHFLEDTSYTLYTGLIGVVILVAGATLIARHARIILKK